MCLSRRRRRSETDRSGKTSLGAAQKAQAKGRGRFPMARTHSADEIAEYRRRTREVLAGGSRDHKAKPGRDWLGNRWETGASKINVMLIDGATLAEMEEARGAPLNHIRDLRDHMGVPIEFTNGVYRFDRRALH